MGKSDALSRRADHGTERGTTTMSRYSVQSSLQLTQSALSGLSLEGEERDILRDIHRETTRASRRTQLRSLQRNSGRSKESHSERQSGGP